jgi:hypothetical protein
MPNHQRTSVFLPSSKPARWRNNHMSCYIGIISGWLQYLQIALLLGSLAKSYLVWRKNGKRQLSLLPPSDCPTLYSVALILSKHKYKLKHKHIIRWTHNLTRSPIVPLSQFILHIIFGQSQVFGKFYQLLQYEINVSRIILKYTFILYLFSIVIRLQRIYNFWWSMLVFTPFAYYFVTLRGTFMHFLELTY